MIWDGGWEWERGEGEVAEGGDGAGGEKEKEASRHGIKSIVHSKGKTSKNKLFGGAHDLWNRRRGFSCVAKRFDRASCKQTLYVNTSKPY